MLKKIVVAASAAAVVLGAGTAALATSGKSASPAPSASSGTRTPGNAAGGELARGNGHRPGLRALRGALHAQWVTRDGSSTTAFVTHDAIRGVVTAVSAGSITVKAADGVSQTYAVTSATKVHLRDAEPGEKDPGDDQSTGRGRGNAGRGNGGGRAGTIADVHTGDKVAVTGTGTTSLTARQIIDRVQ